jgi:hypothetical protein
MNSGRTEPELRIARVDAAERSLLLSSPPPWRAWRALREFSSFLLPSSFFVEACRALTHARRHRQSDQPLADCESP